MDELENEKVRVIYAETQQGGRTSGRNDERRPSEFISSRATPFVFIVHQPSIVSSPPLSDSRLAPSVGSEFHCSHTHVAAVCQTESNGFRATAPPEVRAEAPQPHFPLPVFISCSYYSWWSVVPMKRPFASELGSGCRNLSDVQNVIYVSFRFNDVSDHHWDSFAEMHL